MLEVMRLLMKNKDEVLRKKLLRNIEMECIVTRTFRQDGVYALFGEQSQLFHRTVNSVGLGQGPFAGGMSAAAGR